MSELQPELRTCPFCGNIFEFSGDYKDTKYSLPYCSHACYKELMSYPKETRDKFYDFMFSEVGRKMTNIGIYLETRRLFQK